MGRMEPRHEPGLESAGVGIPPGAQKLVDDLNRLYRSEPALHEGDCQNFGFEWIDANDSEQSVTTFLRRGKTRRTCC